MDQINYTLSSAFSGRFTQLKKQVGGNREKHFYEETHGPLVTDLYGITGPNAIITRILSEINFAMQLSASQNGRWDKEIDAALTLLEQEMSSEQTLTRSRCLAAEQLLLPLAGEAKSYEVLYVGHAHIDMNWMWGWQETVAVTLSTLRTMLNLMKEYPDFTFAQSQASVYKIVEEHDPEMMEEIKQRIREGRWEVTANAWVETDKNMPDTESLLRHISETRSYLQKVWGVEPGSVKVDFSPDTFGHSRFVPEIDRFGNVPYYYHCRGLEQDVTLYRYRAPSGAELLMYKEPFWYNSGINPDNGTAAVEMSRRCMGLKTSMIVYGVGDHGGGVTRRDLENMVEMRTWPIFPTLRFGTLGEYFARAEAVREKLPVVDHELNVLFTGCYTTQSRIKLANRRTETALLDAEMVSALSHQLLGTPFHREQLRTAWQNTLFTHFHDILTGSCVQESREYGMGRLASALAVAQTEQNKAYTAISETVDTSMYPCDSFVAPTLAEGAGAGYGIGNYAGVPNPERGVGKTRIYTVFNSGQTARKENVELTVWDYVGNLYALEVVDEQGCTLPFQLLDTVPQGYWGHRFVRILVQVSVPALGWATCAIREKQPDSYPTYLETGLREEPPKDDIILENAQLTARFDTGCGQLISLTDRSTGEELLRAPAGLALIHTEDSPMSAWDIGRYMGVEPVTETSHVSISRGALRQTVTFEQKVMHSTATVTISLDTDAKALCYDLRVDWHETAKGQDWVPLLVYRLPLKKDCDQILRDVPAGAAIRHAAQIDVPALTGACAAVEGNTAALIADCKYGYRLADHVLSVSLINTASTPDPYPERGIHAIKLFVALTKACPVLLKKTAECLIRPLTGVPTAQHAGSLPSTGTLLGFDAATAILTGISVTEKDGLWVRCYEATGKADQVTVTLPFIPGKAFLSDLDGNPVGEVTQSGNVVQFTIGAYRIAQLIAEK